MRSIQAISGLSGWSIGRRGAFRSLHSAQQLQWPSPTATTTTTDPATAAPSDAPASLAPDSQPAVPDPIPLVPDVATLLKLIGRGMTKYASKIPTWEALFTLNSKEFVELGVKLPRDRRYLLSWLHRFRQHQLGPASDLQFVENGRARLCVWTDYIRDRRRVINIPFGADPLKMSQSTFCFPRDYKVAGTASIRGPWALKQKHEAVVTVQPGMWEQKRGVKVDGGERRKKAVRFQKLVEKRKLLREERAARERN